MKLIQIATDSSNRQRQEQQAQSTLTPTATAPAVNHPQLQQLRHAIQSNERKGPPPSNTRCFQSLAAHNSLSSIEPKDPPTPTISQQLQQQPLTPSPTTMYHHQNQNPAARQGRAFGNTLDGNASNKANADAGKTGTGTTFEKRQTRSMTKRNASKQLQPQPRPNANGNSNSNGAGLAVQRPTTTTMIASTNPFIAPTSRPTAFSSISNLSSYQHTGNVDNIDARDKDDPLCATDYVQEMYNHFRGKEEITSVRPTFMENQPNINERMRAILVDWLIEVHLKFKLVPETLYLCVNLIDRYLSVKEVQRPKLQLVGVACLLIASKYEEIYPPELRDLVYVCDRAYSGNEILEMEEVVLKALDYNVTIASAHCFLVRYLKAAHADKRIVQSSCLLLDGTLTSYTLLHYLPSQLASAAILLARRAVGRNAWSPTLLHYTGYAEEEVLPVARALLAEKNSAPPDLRSVSKKYSSARYGRVAATEKYFI